MIHSLPSAVSYINFVIVGLNLIICLGVSVPICIRNLRQMRTLSEMRNIIYSYEQDLRNQAVKLPPRCVFCFQILPGHVDGCDFKSCYDWLDWATEQLSRPPIKYYPKGERPPDV